MEIKFITPKSLLTPSKIQGVDYVINAYTGCSFGCVYCYASFMCRYLNKDLSDWGNFVYIKTHIEEVLNKDLKKLKNKGEGKSILLSSVTDPYQSLEIKYKATRTALETLLKNGYMGKVSILTKSNLVLRDIDLFKQFKDIEVGLTITSTSDEISRYFEKHAPNVSKRIEALDILNKSGIKTYVFIGPLLPHFLVDPKGLDNLLHEISKTGNKYLFVENINLSTYIVNRMAKEVKDNDVIRQFYISKDKGKKEDLNIYIKSLIKKYNMILKTGNPIDHK